MEDIIKEFREKFPIHGIIGMNLEFDEPIEVQEIEQFILKALQQDRQQLVREIEGKKRNNPQDFIKKL
jgi:hypothetical protein